MQINFSAYVRMIVGRAPEEGSPDRLLEKAVLPFSDDAEVTIYAGDLRKALNAARGI